MDLWYWISEYGKVFCGYLFLMFLWPSVVFHRYLKTKSKTFHFSFCVTVPIVIANTVVLLLGLVHGLNQWLIRLIFYGLFGLALLKNTIIFLDRKYRSMIETEFPDVRTLKGKYRVLVLVILFFVVCYKYVKKAVHFLGFDYIRRIKSCNWTKARLRIKECVWNLGRRISSFFWRYGILALVLFYGVAYFSYGIFQVHSYGYGDLYTHHKWIHGLIEGNIFLDGIYPEAMHCFIYCMHTLFGIKVHSILLYLQVIHVAVFFLAAYLLLKRIFTWRYTPIVVLMLFLTLDLCNADLIHSMFRMQITMPLEFGLHTVCLCALYLINYLNKEHTNTVGNKAKATKFFWDDNLFLFMMSLAAAVAVHFHILLMVLIVSSSFAVFAFRKIFNRKYLIPLVSAAFCAGVIATAPIAGALMQGISFNASIDWALEAMGGEVSRDLREGKTEDIENKSNVEAIWHGEDDGNIKNNEISFTASILRNIIEIYDKGYGTLYGKERGGLMLLLTAIAAGSCWLVRRKEKLRCFREICSLYPPVILVSVIYIFVYAAPMFELPDIIPEGRFFAPGHMMLLAVTAMPVDVLFYELTRICNDFMGKLMSLLSIVGIYVIAMMTGNFRGLLFYELSQYNAAAMVTQSIIDTFPRYSYTIVSPTDELYPVIQYGWHEELLNFIENSHNEKYSIPSEYVFIFVEKKPLLYAQSHFFQGPFWMGEEKYLEPFWEMYSLKYPDSEASQSPEIKATQVSEEEAKRELPEYENAWSMYLQIENRTLLESKAYGWCQWFSKKNPSVLNVYYEDDDFVCYYFRQRVGNLPFNLGVEE